MSRSVPPEVVAHYPCSDDQPMAGSETRTGVGASGRRLGACARIRLALNETEP